MNIDFQKIASFLLVLLIAIISWLGNKVYDATNLHTEKLIAIESKITIEQTKTSGRIDGLEYRVSTIEINYNNKDR